MTDPTLYIEKHVVTYNRLFGFVLLVPQFVYFPFALDILLESYFSGGYIIFTARIVMLRHLEFSTFEETVKKLEENQIWTNISAETFNQNENTDDEEILYIYKVIY